jgi:hypothetical protein
MSDPDFIRFMKTRYSLSQFLVNNRMMWERWPSERKKSDGEMLPSPFTFPIYLM